MLHTTKNSSQFSLCRKLIRISETIYTQLNVASVSCSCYFNAYVLKTRAKMSKLIIPKFSIDWNSFLMVFTVSLNDHALTRGMTNLDVFTPITGRKNLRLSKFKNNLACFPLGHKKTGIIISIWAKYLM